MSARGLTSIDRAILGALARALGATSSSQRSRARALLDLQRLDPLQRTRARRRLREALADAEVATRIKPPEGEAHVMRLAYLLVAGGLPARATCDDVAAVDALYLVELGNRRPEPHAIWWRSASLALGVAALAALPFALSSRSAAVQPSPSPSASEAPTARLTGAFERGGVPAKTPHDTALALALGTDVPNLLIALDKRTDARRAHDEGLARTADADLGAARASALGAEVKEALGTDGYEALGSFLTAAVAASEGGPARGEALARAAGKLDDALAAAGVGYFVDADLLEQADGKNLVLAYSFRVVQVEVYAAFTMGDPPRVPQTPPVATGDPQAPPWQVRALRLRRLDKLNWSHTLLGFTRPNITFAAVLLDQIDEQVLTILAVALADRAPMTLFDPDAPASEREEVEARAGEIARSEVEASPGVDAVAASQLGKLLGERKALLARTEKLAAARGATVVVPLKLRLPEGFEASLKGWVPEADLKALARVDRSLEDRTREDAFVAIRDALTPSIERHEVQHRLDALGPQPPPHPPELAARVGPLVSADGKEQQGAMAARAELSAYLSELAREERMPGVCLAMIARFLFDRRMHGTPESYAALTILEGLAPAVPSLTPAPMLANGHIDRRAVAKVWLGLVALPREKLRAEAKALWERLFRAPLLELKHAKPPSAEGH